MSRDSPRPEPAPTIDGASFLIGGGETGALLRDTDWRASRLGPVSSWPQSLRTSLGICISSRFPIAIYWGPEFVMLYNDDLIPMVGANKHPHAMGRPAFEVLPEIRALIEPLLLRVVETGEAIGSEDLMLPLLRSEAQEESYFTFTYSPIRDESGAVGGVFCAVIETTDKLIEGRRLRLLHALSAATQARTQAEACTVAARRESERARQEAEAAARTQRDVREFQERFVAVLGHDLRNPLAAIAMGTGLLRQQMSNPATERTLNRISSSTRRMSRMVEQILDLSRARIGGGLAIVPVAMDLYATLNAVIDEVRGAHPGRAFEVQGSPMRGTWDRDRLEQVFSNLVSNAIHHGHADSPIRIVAGQDEDRVHIAVHNEGSPIPAPMRAMLFDPFRRGDRDASASKSSGLGLGLFISRELVLAHGGDIDVHSTATGGTTFRVTLPRTVPTARPEPRP